MGTDSIERLLLPFEELGSNGLRHGRPPIRVTVATTRTGWVVDVSDTAVDTPPSPAVGRDPAQGGMGLRLVARLASGHGWEVRDGRKHVWACIAFGRARAGRRRDGRRARPTADTGAAPRQTATVTSLVFGYGP